MTRCRRTKAVRKWVAVTSHPFFGSGFCWPESSSLPLIAHADDGTCIHTRTTRAHLLLIWKFERNTVKPLLSSREFSRRAFFFFAPSLSLFPSFFFLFSACFELSRSENLCFLERAVSTPLEDPWEPFAAGTMKRHCVSDKGFKEGALWSRTYSSRIIYEPWIVESNRARIR